MAIFITMNPGYAGRSNLPDNLKKLFRSLAMTTPDRQLIAQVMLYSQGFRTAEKLAEKIVPFFKLVSSSSSFRILPLDTTNLLTCLQYNNTIQLSFDNALLTGSSEVHLTPRRRRCSSIAEQLCVKDLPKGLAQRTCPKDLPKGLAQGSYVVVRGELEPANFHILLKYRNCQ